MGPVDAACTECGISIVWYPGFRMLCNNCKEGAATHEQENKDKRNAVKEAEEIIRNAS